VLDLAALNLGITEYPHNITDYEFSNISKEHRQEIMRLFRDPYFMGSVLPIPGTIKKLIEWNRQDHNLVVITAREKPVRKCTIELVNHWFPMISNVYFVDIKESKSKLMQELKIDVWIDDAPYGVMNSLELKIPTYLVSNTRTQYNHTIRSLLPACRVVKDVAAVSLDKPCPWCEKLPRCLMKQPILDTKSYHFKFGCNNNNCKVQPYTEGLCEQTCIDIWNSREIEYI
jgi:hypothetical protein